MFYDATPVVFENARDLRHKMTEAERILWGMVSKKQIMNYRFRRQHPIGKFIADFYCHQAKLVIEVDGEIHDHPDHLKYDAERTRELESLGIRVLRFTNRQIFSQLEETIQIIKDHLNKQGTSPSGGQEG